MSERVALGMPVRWNAESWKRVLSKPDNEEVCMTVEEATEKFPREAGIARYGEPEEIAELMAFLVSPDAGYINGAYIPVDGGLTASVGIPRG